MAVDGLAEYVSPLRQIDAVLHSAARLAIVSALAVSDRLTFNQLIAILGATNGNLSTQARKLEDAKYIRCDKMFEDRKPQTLFAITPAGREALERYFKQLEDLIGFVRASGKN
jgi:DNA-binding MarR family transcriptional regulator